MRSGWSRVRAALRPRAGRRRGRWITGIVCLVIGLMISISSLNARGFDLRPGRNTQLIDVIRDNSRRNAELTRTVVELRGDVDELSRRAGAEPDQSDRIAAARREAAMQAVSGPGYTVTLTDAPLSVQVPGVDEDLLVVHQQDIQSVVNALWASGAEAMTIQGQRVVSTTGIKCVGSTVVLHGIPYAPPYVISAIGDPDRLAAGLEESVYLQAYRHHAEAYDLGYQQKRETELNLPAFGGSVALQYARTG